MKSTCALITVGLCTLLSAEITIFGNENNYTTLDGGWLSNVVYDIDANGLGTDGYIFFGDYEGGESAGNPFSMNVQALPDYVSSITQGANFVQVAEGFAGYGQIDSPIALNGSNALSGFALGTAGSAGNNLEIAKFTISGLAQNEVVRVGVLAGVENNNDSRWDPTSITLSDGAASATVGRHGSSPLPNASPSNTGWVFFDVNENGQYSVLTTKRRNTQGAGIGGITFDSVSSSSASSFVLPHIGEVELKDLQAMDGSDGDMVQAAVRQLKVDNGSYLSGAIVPLGAYAEGTVHKLVINSTTGDSASLVEFAVTADGVLDLVKYHQAGVNPFTLLNAGSLGGSLELALVLPLENHGDVTVTHYTSSLNKWADTQYEESHFGALTEDVIIETSQGDLSMGVYTN